MKLDDLRMMWSYNAPVNQQDEIEVVRAAYMVAWKCKPEWVDLIVDLYHRDNDFKFNARGRFIGGVVRDRDATPLPVATSLQVFGTNSLTFNTIEKGTGTRI